MLEETLDNKYFLPIRINDEFIDEQKLIFVFNFVKGNVFFKQNIDMLMVGRLNQAYISRDWIKVNNRKQYFLFKIIDFYQFLLGAQQKNLRNIVNAFDATYSKFTLQPERLSDLHLYFFKRLKYLVNF